MGCRSTQHCGNMAAPQPAWALVCATGWCNSEPGCCTVCSRLVRTPRGLPASHLQPRLILTFTMAPLTDPIQRKSRTLPPSRMYLGASGGCEHRLGQHRGCNNTWTAGHERHTCQPRIGHPPSAAPSATQIACPRSPGLGGSGGGLRHVAAVQQLEAHRLAGLLGLAPRVGALRGQGRRARALRLGGRTSEAEERECTEEAGKKVERQQFSLAHPRLCANRRLPSAGHRIPLTGRPLPMMISSTISTWRRLEGSYCGVVTHLG